MGQVCLDFAQWGRSTSSSRSETVATRSCGSELKCADTTLMALDRCGTRDRARTPRVISIQVRDLGTSGLRCSKSR